MTAVTLVGNEGAPRLTYANLTPSNVVTNLTAETAFDTAFTMPAQSTRTFPVGTLLRLKCYGTVSTALLNFNLNLRARWGGLAGTVMTATGAFGVGASLSDAGWWLELTALVTATGAAGAMEVQGSVQTQAGLLSSSQLHLVNTSTIAINTINSADLVISAQWTTASASNQIQVRSYVLDIDGP